LTIFTVGRIPGELKDHALLSGPFLAFTVAIVLVAIFHRPLREMLTKGNLTLSWGDKTISVQEIEENFDRELEARLEALASEVEDLRERLPAVAAGASAAAGDRSEENEFRPGALRRISDAFRIESEDLAAVVYHLGTSKYKWRNQQTLAKRTGLSAGDIEELVGKAPQLVVRSRGKSGNTIFRLTDSAKRDFGAIVAPGA
jgi:hypothetical protein